MERTRTRRFLLLMMGLAALVAVPPSAAVGAAAGQAPAAAALAVAGQPPCDCGCELKCPCGCSPLAGAWVAKLSSPKETVIQTFKFAPINDGCNKFVVNSQASTRSVKVVKAWPDACELTEFVGTACQDEWNDLQLTAIGYGVKRCDTIDKVQFIAIMTAHIDLPDECLECEAGDKDADGKYSGVCKEPDEMAMTVYVSYFDAQQDLDRDGFPDGKCDEAVICVCYTTVLKRVPVLPPCEESKSFLACLEACKDCNTPATGRAFFRVLQDEKKVCFLVTVKDLKDVKKVCLEVASKAEEEGTCAVVLCPFPPETKGPDGDCDGLLCCGCFLEKDGLGPWKNKKIKDIAKSLEDGYARVVVSTEKYPKGEICGKIADP